MVMSIKKSLFLFGLLPLSVFAQGPNPIITVYSTQDYPILHAELASQVYLLDQVEQWENLISQRLSANPSVAAQQASQIFQSAEWKQSEEQLKRSYQGLISGWQNGIKKVPAVLFQYPGKEDSVIYGETNIAQALSLWQREITKEGQDEIEKNDIIRALYCNCVDQYFRTSFGVRSIFFKHCIDYGIKRFDKLFRL